MSDDLNRKRILVADDENSVRRLLHEILGANFDVIEAQNGEEAVSLSQSQRPDLIVMDMIMPRMDGITACSLIRRDEITADIPVIMLTAIDHYLNRNLAENTGVNVYLTKPFNHHDLIRTVNELLTESTSNSRSTTNS